MKPWREKWNWLFTDNRKDSGDYWRASYYYLETEKNLPSLREEYIDHHYDFFSISIIAQAARDGAIPHSDVTEAVILMIGVDTDPGDTEVPVGYEVPEDFCAPEEWT